LPQLKGLFLKWKAHHFEGWKSFLVIGGLGSAVATITFTKAFALINPSLVIFFQKFQPLFAISLAYGVLGEKLSKEFVLLGLVCLLGGFLMASEEVSSALAYISENLDDPKEKLLTEKHFYGLLFTFIAVIGWGSSTVFGKKLGLLSYSEKEIMTGRFTIGFISLVPMTLILHQGDLSPLASFDRFIWGKLIVMVLVSGLLGMGLYYLGLKRTQARMAALAEMFFPFCALGLNWIFLDAQLNLTQIIGAVLLLVGSTLIQWKHY
jgi:drug/metabolite transporter (DMT)-like permease